MNQSNPTEKIKELAEGLANLTLKEVTQLSDLLKDQYGIEPVAAAAPVAAATAQPAEEKEEKANVDVVLAGLADASKKIAVIKVVKEILKLGLKEAKDLVDNAPQTMQEGVSKEDGEAMKAKLEAAGAKVDLK